MATSLEHVLQLFDSVWFHNQILQSEDEKQCYQKVLVTEDEEEEPEKVQRENAQSLKVRSHSENFLISSGNSFLSDSQSPTSVLPTPRLETIFSGKETADFDKSNTKEGSKIKAVVTTKPCDKKNANRQRRQQWRGGRAGSSKSLTDLEFEELKGFQDLGFVFLEEYSEDADLVSIVPGLQRLRRRSESNEMENDSVKNVVRPYLSEAWSVMEKKEALMKPAALIINQSIRKGSMGNEMLMKEQIKCWAHTVATAIR